ncbi:MAG TPA: hypothetical protein PLZ84_08910, partial [Clostridia bacterium]|nr:hypothetical protein [Clostridia bacterium]
TVSFIATLNELQTRTDVVASYNPDLQYYTTHAQAFTSKLITNPDSHLNIAFVFSNAKVVEILETDNRFVFLVELLGFDNARIAMEYRGNIDIEVGKVFRIFADVAGTYPSGDSTYPHLIARFIYNA